jgi:hypothetical protein
VYGQAYAQLFPTRVGRMYLDGVADHTQPKLKDWLRSYATTQERQLLRFRDWCNQRVSCALHGSDAAAVWVELVARAERASLPAPSAGAGQTVSVEQLFAGALVGMNPPNWPKLAQAMAAARAGDAGQFHTVLRSPPPEEFALVSNALLCHDFISVQPGYQEFLALESRLRAVAPAFGWIEGRYELGRCLGIRGEPNYPPRPMSVPGLAPILIGIGHWTTSPPTWVPSMSPRSYRPRGWCTTATAMSRAYWATPAWPGMCTATSPMGSSPHREPAAPPNSPPGSDGTPSTGYRSRWSSTRTGNGCDVTRFPAVPPASW